jgi:hypothetical protein
MRLSATRLRATGGAIFRTAGGGGGFDADATAYIAAVEAADGAALEAGVKTAINTFVVGCKADGIWTALKASCILAGARTLSGALVPLAGTAPTNNNFVSGDYDRKTGLVGDGTSKYLNSNRNNNADPQNSKHLATYVSTATTSTQFGGNIGFLGGPAYIGRNSGLAQLFCNGNGNTFGSSTGTGFQGISRSSGSEYLYRLPGGQIGSIISASQTPGSGNIEVFSGGSSLFANARLAFYSIGEALDLALLDARVTTLISAYAAAIP